MTWWRSRPRPQRREPVLSGSAPAARLPGDGWREWLTERPYAHRSVEIMREEWPCPYTIDPRRLHPLTNVAGLWWRENP